MIVSTLVTLTVLAMHWSVRKMIPQTVILPSIQIKIFILYAVLPLNCHKMVSSLHVAIYEKTSTQDTSTDVLKFP